MRLAALALAMLALKLVEPPAALADERDALELARTCVSEAGWTPGDDCRAIGAVLRGLARRRGVSIGSAARLASPRLAACRVRRRWLCGLDERGREPAAWPSSVAWSAHRLRWFKVLELARRIVDGLEPSPCIEEPHTWGSVDDWRRARARRARLRVVDCGPSVQNAFGVSTATAPRDRLAR